MMKKNKQTVKSKKTKAVAKSSPAKTASGDSRYQDVLLSKRADILDTVRKKDADVSTSDIGDELDVASQTFEREMMFELTNGERVVLDDIEAALRKIEKGEFGICESCHKKIPSARLHAMPWARYCIECQTRTETQRV